MFTQLVNADRAEIVVLSLMCPAFLLLVVVAFIIRLLVRVRS